MHAPENTTSTKRAEPKTKFISALSENVHNILQHNPPASSLAEAAVSQLLNELFSYIEHRANELEIAELNNLATTLQRLLSGVQQVETLKQEAYKRGEIFDDEKSSNGLSQSLVTALENKLRLL